MAAKKNTTGFAALRKRVKALLNAIDAEAQAWRREITASRPRLRPSAFNLAHYIGLRKQEVRQLQLDLAGLALSSLGRSEGHVRDTLVRLESWLAQSRPGRPAREALDTAKANAILHENSYALFGPHPPGRHVFVMVTTPEAKALTRTWADRVIKAGADVLRINAAHESPAAWRKSIGVLRERAKKTGKDIKIFVDLPGPKLRGDIRDTQSTVLHFSRQHDRRGKTIEGNALQLVAKFGSGMQIPVPPVWLERLHTGDRLYLEDAGGRKRRIIVRKTGARSAIAECKQSLFVTAGLPLEWHRGRNLIARGRVGALPAQPVDIRLSRGDRFVINETGRSARAGRKPVLACPAKRVLAQIKRGERIVLDDGRIVAIVESSRGSELLCRVTATSKEPARLRSGKGLAFPDSDVSLPNFGEDDETALKFALRYADGVNVSFVNAKADVDRIAQRLRKAKRKGFGMVLKLETRGSIRNLPEILFAALRYRPAGLMIARGDLAVEASFEELAHLQEEILGFGEACHLPVIWATQVLDNVAHTGVPTRAEVTDAAMSMRAECVMLNKGPYVAEATRMLVQIIRDMEPRQYKKRSLFSKL